MLMLTNCFITENLLSSLRSNQTNTELTFFKSDWPAIKFLYFDTSAIFTSVVRYDKMGAVGNRLLWPNPVSLGLPRNHN